ncbi:HpcH/HpaI aldolase/citrate lyase family protein [Rhodococcoides navarretei]|uniref:CoA ester lyase n=1 Tax=Rhodococcus navarretei TaxID=3128981 RepID=A0ABU9D1L8_9NOCA
MTPTEDDDTTAIPTAWLFTPGTDPEHFDVAARCGAGVAILDLEDAVAKDHKDRARDSVIEHLKTRDVGDVRCAVRINPPNTVTGLRDLLALADSGVAPDYVVVPKVDAAATVDIVAEVLADAGLVTGVVAMIETAFAATTLHTIIQDARSPIAALMYGAADMAGDLGAETGTAVLAQARSACLLAAAAARIPVIDTPFFDIGDAAGLGIDIADAVRSGFSAKAAVHPAQIAPIVERFTPSADQIDWATNVVDTATGGVGTVDGQMVDEAIARRARRILARARR